MGHLRAKCRPAGGCAPKHLAAARRRTRRVLPTPTQHKNPAARWAAGFLVPVVGLEPTRCRHQRILSPSRLPFHHTGLTLFIISYLFLNFKYLFSSHSKHFIFRILFRSIFTFFIAKRSTILFWHYLTKSALKFDDIAVKFFIVR